MMSLTKAAARGVRIVLIACFCTLVAVGCGSKLTQENVDKVKVGMSEADVVALLGKPTGSTTTKMPGGSASRENWKEDNKSVRIDFLDGKVVVIDKSGM
jgi:hypothetical protein